MRIANRAGRRGTLRSPGLRRLSSGCETREGNRPATSAVTRYASNGQTYAATGLRAERPSGRERSPGDKPEVAPALLAVFVAL
jgi:hypothetical protein